MENMKYLKYGISICLLVICTIVNGQSLVSTANNQLNSLVNSNLVDPCPEEFYIDDDGNLVFVLQGIHLGVVYEWDFYFGIENTRNDKYTASVYHNVSENITRLIFAGLDLEQFKESGGITFQLNEDCYYRNGVLCADCSESSSDPFEECADIFDNCAFEWDLFFQEHQFDITCNKWFGQCYTYSKLHRPGKVSIGTLNASSQAALTVKGGIIADKFKITTCDDGEWCDYVFEEDYNLFSLEEVEEHIMTNGHLHKTPSAKEVESVGSFEVKTVTLDHQEKIEEAFLHLIDLKKEANQLEQKIKALKAENVKLKKTKCKE